MPRGSVTLKKALACLAAFLTWDTKVVLCDLGDKSVVTIEEAYTRADHQPLASNPIWVVVTSPKRYSINQITACVLKNKNRYCVYDRLQQKRG